MMGTGLRGKEIAWLRKESQYRAIVSSRPLLSTCIYFIARGCPSGSHVKNVSKVYTGDMKGWKGFH